MMPNTNFSDEELVAYLDNEADFAPIDEIAAALKTDIALAKRLERLRIDTNAVRNSFEGLVDPDKKPPALPLLQTSSTSHKNVAAAAAIALIAGFSGGYLMKGEQQQDWKDYVAAYQALYTNSTLNHVQVSAAQQQTELDRVAPAIGKQIKLASLTDNPDVEYKRAQILGFNGKPLIQLAFLTSLGEPMALCILRSDSGENAGIEMAKMEGMRSAYWSKDGYDYILIGGSDPDKIARLASNFAKKPI